MFLCMLCQQSVQVSGKEQTQWQERHGNGQSSHTVTYTGKKEIFKVGMYVAADEYHFASTKQSGQITCTPTPQDWCFQCSGHGVCASSSAFSVASCMQLVCVTNLCGCCVNVKGLHLNLCHQLPKIC